MKRMSERFKAPHKELRHKRARLLDPIGTIFPGIVDDIGAACHIIQKRNQKPGIYKHRGQNRLPYDEQRLFPKHPFPQNHCRYNDKERCDFRGNHMGEKDSRTAGRNGDPAVPVPSRIFRQCVKLPQPIQDKRHKGHGRILSHRRPRVNAGKTVYIKRIENGTDHPDFWPAHFRERIVGNTYGKYVDHYHIAFVCRLDRHAAISEQSRKIQKEIAVKHRGCIPVAVQPSRLDPHREHAVFQSLPDALNPHQMKIQVMGI